VKEDGPAIGQSDAPEELAAAPIEEKGWKITKNSTTPTNL
jgi:hypothetical protein